MERVITDRAGRRLSLRKVGVLETLRLFKALGPELSNNQPYMSMAHVAVQVAMIDDVPLPFPVNEAGLELLLERIGDAGMTELLAVSAEVPLANLMAEAGN